MIIIGYEWWAYGNSLYYFLYFCTCLKFFQTRKWRCDFRDDVWDSWPPKWPHHDPLCNLLPHWIRAGPCDRREGDRCDFGELVTVTFALLLDLLLWGTSATMLCRHWSSLVVRSLRKGAKASCQQAATRVSRMSDPLWKLILLPQSSLPVTASPSDIWLQLHEGPPR